MSRASAHIQHTLSQFSVQVYLSYSIPNGLWIWLCSCYSKIITIQNKTVQKSYGTIRAVADLLPHAAKWSPDYWIKIGVASPSGNIRPVSLITLRPRRFSGSGRCGMFPPEITAVWDAWRAQYDALRDVIICQVWEWSITKERWSVNVAQSVSRLSMMRDSTGISYKHKQHNTRERQLHDNKQLYNNKAQFTVKDEYNYAKCMATPSRHNCYICTTQVLH